MAETTTKRKAFPPKKTANPMMGLEAGKVPPHAVDLEEAVLGALMLEKDALTDVIQILRPESFYRQEHVHIYETIQQLFQESEPIDILSVTNNLKKTGKLDLVGGAYYISKLTDRVASSANAEFHARIIAQKHIQRELIRVSGEIYHDAFEDTTDVFDLLDRAEQNLFAVTEGNIRKDVDEMKSLIAQAVEDIEKAGLQESGVRGVPSGFVEVDRVTAGWQKQDLLIIAARPGMGKTSFILSMARNMGVDHNRPIAVFSLEMSALQLTNRLIASETELSASKLREGSLEPHEWEQLNSKLHKLSQAPIYIDDTPSLSVFELRAKCRRLKAQHNIELIMVDYLQLMTAGGDNKNGGNREQEISMISRSLKSIAKELDIPVVCLSQLSRNVETRGGVKRPMLSDLRESGAIEQDADMVMFIYRPEYYGLEETETGMPTAGYAELIIAKHRNGALKDVPLRFIGNLAKFTDWESHDFDLGGAMPISNEFEGGGGQATRTIPSKMNDDDDSAPF